MKRFALFSGSNYYPSGGWGDFRDTFDTEEEAVEAGRKACSYRDWYHVVDLESGTEVA